MGYEEEATSMVDSWVLLLICCDSLCIKNPISGILVQRNRTNRIREIGYKELTHLIVEIKKIHNLPSAS